MATDVERARRERAMMDWLLEHAAYGNSGAMADFAEAEVQRTVGEIVANLRTYASENPGDVTCAALNNAADRIKAEFGGAK